MTCTLVEGAAAEEVTTVLRVEVGLMLVDEVIAFDDDGESVDEGTGVALLTAVASVEDGCEPPPAVPEACPESLM